VTVHKPPLEGDDVEASGRALALRLQRRVDQLARAMLDAILDEVPFYRRLPREQLEGEVLAICRSNLSAFLATLAEGRPPSEDDLATMRASAARRATEQIPLEAVLIAYHVGGRVGWDALCAEAAPEERDDLLAVATWLIDYLQAATSTVAGAYLEERQSIYGEQRDAKRALVEALLSGLPADTLAARVGTELAPRYVVLSLRVERSADEKDEGVDGTVASRRKVRRLEDALAEAGARGTLALLTPTGGWVLVPSDEAGPPAAWVEPGLLVQHLTAAAGVEVTAGIAFRPDLAGMADAAAEADQVLRLVVELGYPPGAYRVDDVLLDFVLTRPSPARDLLAAVLIPLEDGPDLIATLEAYLAADFDRRGAAAALHVHPNTLDYRLRRVAELTGLDPSTTRGLQHLGAALTVRRSHRPRS
jgi:hypothetical protein